MSSGPQAITVAINTGGDWSSLEAGKLRETHGLLEQGAQSSEDRLLTGSEEAGGYSRREVTSARRPEHRAGAFQPQQKGLSH